MLVVKMEFISRISSPVSEAWIAWVLLLMLFFAFVNRLFIADIVVAFRSMSSHGERSYGSGTNSLQSVTWIYRVVLLSLLIFLFLVDGGLCFSLANFGIILGGITIVYWLQWGLIKLVGSVFLDRRRLVSATEQRTVIHNAICGMLMPVVMVMLWQVNDVVVVLVASIAIVYLVVLMMRAFQLYYNNLLSLLYILLYIINLEILPLAGAILWLKNFL
jgi:hypothetical protein